MHASDVKRIVVKDGVSGQRWCKHAGQIEWRHIGGGVGQELCNTTIVDGGEDAGNVGVEGAGLQEHGHGGGGAGVLLGHAGRAILRVKEVELHLAGILLPVDCVLRAQTCIYVMR